MGIPEIVTRNAQRAHGRRLVDVAVVHAHDGVVEVETEDHGTLAVGLSDGVPFAVSNLCRHQLAKLGQGQVRDGDLECPWHRARYDVATGHMTRGPQGRIFGFGPYARTFQTLCNRALPLRRFPVELRDDAIWLGAAAPA